MSRIAFLALPAALLAAASPVQAGAPALPGPGEVVHYLGTEPFWGGELRGRRMTLDWPENEKGVSLPVVRTVSRGRLVISGRLAVHPHFMPAGRFTMTIVRKTCSDGMSDQVYPYDVTIVAGNSRILGCAWTARRPYREVPSE